VSKTHTLTTPGEKVVKCNINHGLQSPQQEVRRVFYSLI